MLTKLAKTRCYVDKIILWYGKGAVNSTILTMMYVTSAIVLEGSPGSHLDDGALEAIEFRRIQNLPFVLLHWNGVMIKVDMDSTVDKISCAYYMPR